MKERPILMNGAMVRATLREVDPKTQTRRVAGFKPLALGLNMQFSGLSAHEITPGCWALMSPDGSGARNERTAPLRCPYGVPGDRLWVRETWSSDFANHYPFDRVWYAADDDRRRDIEVRDGVRGIFSPESGVHVPFRWHPSIHMPRAASRIRLEITGVRVERLLSISEDDAMAEGIRRTSEGFEVEAGTHFHAASARESFLSLWDSLNAERGFGSDKSPWVWVISFRRFTA